MNYLVQQQLLQQLQPAALLLELLHLGPLLDDEVVSTYLVVGTFQEVASCRGEACLGHHHTLEGHALLQACLQEVVDN